MAEFNIPKLKQKVLLYSKKQYNSYEYIVNLNDIDLNIYGSYKEKPSIKNENILLDQEKVFKDVEKIGKYFFKMFEKEIQPKNKPKNRIPKGQLRDSKGKDCYYLNKLITNDFFEKALLHIKDIENDTLDNDKILNNQLDFLNSTFLDNVLFNFNEKIQKGIKSKIEEIYTKYTETLKFEDEITDEGVEFGISDKKHIKNTLVLYVYIYVIYQIFDILFKNDIKIHSNEKIKDIYFDVKTKKKFYNYINLFIIKYKIEEINTTINELITFIINQMNYIENNTSFLGYRSNIILQGKKSNMVETYHSIAGIAYEYLKRYIVLCINGLIYKKCDDCRKYFYCSNDNNIFCDDCKSKKNREASNGTYKKCKDLLEEIKKSNISQIEKLNNKDRSLVELFISNNVTITYSKDKEKCKKLGIDISVFQIDNLRRIKEELESN